MEKLDNDIVSLMEKRVIDLAGVMGGKKCKIFLNGNQVEIKDFTD